MTTQATIPTPAPPVPDDIRQIIVFTDLDGTLLDHYTYSAEPALGAIRKLQKLKIPLIFNTSKTLAECEALSEKLGLSDPFIVENGSATYYPKRRFRTPPEGAVSRGAYWQVVAGLGYEQIRERLGLVATDFNMVSLGQSSLEDICAATGLSLSAARRARTRQHSEPIIWQDSDEALQRFGEALKAYDLTLLRGGRFLHVLGNTDKGKALQAVQQVYRAQGKKVASIALGDGENDIAMLAAADYPVLIRSPAHELPILRTSQPLTVSEAHGPRGWAESLKNLLKTL